MKGGFLYRGVKSPFSESIKDGKSGYKIVIEFFIDLCKCYGLKQQAKISNKPSTWFQIAC